MEHEGSHGYGSHSHRPQTDSAEVCKLEDAMQGTGDFGHVLWATALCAPVPAHMLSSSDAPCHAPQWPAAWAVWVQVKAALAGRASPEWREADEKLREARATVQVTLCSSGGA